MISPAIFSQNLINTLQSSYQKLKLFFIETFTLNSPRSFLNLILISLGLLIPIFWLYQGFTNITPDFSHRIWVMYYPLPISARWYSFILFGIFTLISTFRFKEYGFFLGVIAYSSYDIFWGGRFTDTTIVLFLMLITSLLISRPRFTPLNYITLLTLFVRGGLSFLPSPINFMLYPPLQKPLCEILWLLFIYKSFQPHLRTISSHVPNKFST